MPRRLLGFVVLLMCTHALRAAPDTGGGQTEPQDAAAAFDVLTAEFLETTLERSPVWATQLGDHRFDDRWPDIRPESRQWEMAWYRQVRGQLEQIPADQLDAEARVDHAILAHHLEAGLFQETELKPWETNPRSAVGTVGGGLDYLVSREFAPLPERLASLQGRLETLPAFLDQAQAALGTPPKIHTETAIEQTEGLIGFVNGRLREGFAAVPEREAALNAAADTAAAALEEYRAFLETEVLPRATDEFRLGPELFEQKLRYSLDTDMTADQVLVEAWRVLDETTVEMGVVAAELHPELFPGEPVPGPRDNGGRIQQIRRVLDRMAEDHPTDDTIIAEAERTLAEATAFVAEHDLVTLPGDPVQIIEMPEFKRGVAIAYCDTPGPFEQNPQTFYAIAPPPADWPTERRESFYREYNSTMLRELTIHEAMPGHYLQLAHSADFESDVRALFGSGTFVEGWAIYSEWMMVGHGFGGQALRMQQLKLVLRLAINTIIDNGIHVHSMTQEEAIELMTVRGFQEAGEAEGKWTRACLTSTQLSTYLVGMLEVRAIREDFEAQAGETFDLKAFNDELIAHGRPAPRHLRGLVGLPTTAATAPE